MRILVLEEDVALARSILQILEGMSSHIEIATNEYAGVRALGVPGWDLILLDHQLLTLGRLNLLEGFRRTNIVTPVLVVARTQASDEHMTAIQLGADATLCLPDELGDLVPHVRALTRREGIRTAKVLEYSDIKVDLIAGQCTRNGNNVELTAKERELLGLFLRFPDCILSRSRIYGTVWDEHYDGLSNTLEVHISELRRKLETQGPRLIYTIRGRGYRLATHSYRVD